MARLQLPQKETVSIEQLKEEFHHSPDFLRIWIPGIVVPKLRPRSNGKKRSYIPRHYRLWKNKNSSELMAAIMFNDYSFDWNRVSISFWDKYPISDAKIASHFCCGLRGDRDNCHGAILDVLVDAKIIEDDKTKIHPVGDYHTYTSKTIKGTLVLIKPGAKILEFTPSLLLGLVP